MWYASLQYYSKRALHWFREAVVRNKTGYHDIGSQDFILISEVASDREPTTDAMNKATALIRKEVEDQPYLRRILQLYTHYVLGGEFAVELTVDVNTADFSDPQRQEQDKGVIQVVTDILTECREANQKAWTPLELVKRTYRDGEQFTYIDSTLWPPKLRFIDPETIGDTPETDDRGVITVVGDATTPVSYRQIDPDTKQQLAVIDAESVVHTKIDVDSNVKRGKSRFLSFVRINRRYESFMDTEVRHRQLQASMVIQKKVAGGGSKVPLMLDNSRTSTVQEGGMTLNKERLHAGTLFTTSQNVEIEFKQPQSNYSDASPLAASILSQLAAASGWTYNLIAATAGEGNLAGQLLNEAPVRQMVVAERTVFTPDLVSIYERLLERGMNVPKYRKRLAEFGVLSVEDLWERYRLAFTYPILTPRDEHKEAQTATSYVMIGAWSPQEAARRSNVDPTQMARERLECLESRPDINFQSLSNQQPTANDRGKSSTDNAAKGNGSNQGNGDPIRHGDNAGVGSSQKD